MRTVALTLTVVSKIRSVTIITLPRNCRSDPIIRQTSARTVTPCDSMTTA